MPTGLHSSPMRHTLAGFWFVLSFILAVAFLSPTSFAQIRGEIESIGLGGYYRPDSWTPMVVRVRTAGLEPALYRLQVIQEDLDRDRQAFTRTISIDPSQTEQRFWMYFIPQPSGLPDTGDAGSLDVLRKNLRVQLTTTGGRGIGQMSHIQVPTSLDGPAGEPLRRGQRLVLAVADGNHAPVMREYIDATGIMEGVVMALVRPRDLPENAIAYSGVDAILWLNADSAELDQGGARRSAAIEQYVRQGGKLVVCQPAERDRLLSISHLLPIDYSTRTPGGGNLYSVEIRDTTTLEPLRTLAREGVGQTAQTNRVWQSIAPPYRIAVATPKPDALVEDRYTLEWPDKKTSPWIVRGVVGLGGVTWVAQDLGDPSLTARTNNAGWSRIWDTIFGWNNETIPLALENKDDSRGFSEPNRSIDLGYTFLRGMDHPGRGVQLVLLAVVFFILYWVAAGPGGYFALVHWNKKQFSWLAFAACALVATLVTMGVVRLVVRGSPAIKHVTVIRTPPTGPSIATSRIGLYIPNDGSIPVTLEGAAPQSLSNITAYAEHPQQRRDTELPPVQGEYIVPIPDETSDETPTVAFPYRSTLKKVQATWVGDLQGRINGSAQLTTDLRRGVEGVLTNNTGSDLRFAYIAFRNTIGQVRVIYKENWRSGTTIDFSRDVASPAPQVVPPGLEMNTDDARQRFGLPRDGRRDQAGALLDIIGPGTAQANWTSFWFSLMRSRAGDTINIAQFDDSTNGYLHALPLLAMYDLIPTVRNVDPKDFSRFEILRRGARQMNMSHIVTNGQMLVLAVPVERKPLPFPLLVDGDPYGGDGDVLLETVIPLNRTPVASPTTAATTQTTP